jgi:hypothetical protein
MTNSGMKKIESLNFGKDSKILVYDNIDGPRQVNRNSLRAKKELRVIEASYASLSVMFEQHEAEEIRKKFLKNRTKIYEITNHAYRDYTNVEGFDEICMDTRYIDPKRFTIDVETLIYDDVVAFYTYNGEDLFSFEVISERFAETQKRFFDSLWRTCERPVIGKGGRSSLF